MPSGIKRTKEEVERIVNKHGYKLIAQYQNRGNYLRKVIIQDKDGYKYDVGLSNFINKNRKPSFVHTKNPFTIENISLWLQINNKNFYICKNVVYSKSHLSKLKLHCLLCDEDFYLGWDCILRGQGCCVCVGRQVGKRTNLGYLRPDLVKEWSEKNKTSPFAFALNSNKKVIWICSVCGYEWASIISSRTGGRHGCPGCSGHAVTDKNRLSVLYPELMQEWDFLKNKNLPPSDYSYGSSKKVWWICSKCKGEWVTSICNRTSSKGCPRCFSSKGNKIIGEFLVENNINFIPEYRFCDCRDKYPLPFDFYLLDYNICIEYNGQQHYNNLLGEFFGGEKELVERQKRDKIKREYCEKNNISLIIIPYWEFNNTQSILSERFKI